MEFTQSSIIFTFSLGLKINIYSQASILLRISQIVNEAHLS